MITIRDVAREAEVSVATVSRVMNNTAKVNEETRERVLGVMQSLNYVPSPAARSMRFQRTPSVEIILSGQPPAAEEGLSIIEAETELRGWALHSYSVPKAEWAGASFLKLYELLTDVRIIFVSDADTAQIDVLRACSDKSGVILVGNIALEGYSCVLLEERAGMRRMTRALLKKGAKQIAYVGESASYLDGIKFSAFAEEIGQAGRKINTKFLYSGGTRMKDGVDAAKHFLRRGSRIPDAVIFESEAAAFGFAQYCRRENASLAHKIKLAAFGSGEYAAFFPMPFTLCSVRKKQMRLAIQAALNTASREAFSGAEIVEPVEMKIKEYL